MHQPSAVILAGVLLASRLAAAAPEIPSQPVVQPPARNLEFLINALGDENFRTRESATREIWALGDAALPALKEAAASADPEQVFRARDLLRKIQLHITPDTDPSVTALVERYLKASLSEKSALFGRMKAKRAWRQMLKLYAGETTPEAREKLRRSMDGIAVRAARERLLKGDSKGAREFLEIAPADSEGLLALAEFHRSHGTLEAELDRARTAEGRKASAWRLALERASGNLQAAREAAESAGELRIAAVMAALAGDPLPWLKDPETSADDADPIGRAYAELAAKRWVGAVLRPADLKVLTRLLTSKSDQQSGAAMNALFLLNEVAAAEPTFVKTEPLAAFRHFESLERIPEALKAMGFDPDRPDFQSWVAKTLEKLASKNIEDQHEASTVGEELVTIANFLERRGMHQQALDAFSAPLATLAEKHADHFYDFLRTLFSHSEVPGGAPMLATRIGVAWAGDDDRRWEEFVIAAFGDDDQASAWWDWLATLDPAASRAQRFEGMLALFGIGPDRSGLRERWLSRAWKEAEEADGGIRENLMERIFGLTAQRGDVATSMKAWKQLPQKSRDELFWGQHIMHLSALERWDEAAEVILGQIKTLTEARQDPGPELHAYAAAALRRAGRAEEALVHDAWADRLALGSPTLAMRIGNGYSFGLDFKRAGEWWARAARESDPTAGEFALALKLHADALLEDGRWKESAAISEVIARIYATSEFRWTQPLPFMRQRLQADLARGLANLKTRRVESLALLEQSHRVFVTDGSLADFFFPALRKAGLLKEYDRWFQQTWDLMEAVIREYPESDNTRNTAAWFASRAVQRLDEAEKHLVQALAANPNQPAYLDTMAEIHFARGNRAKALEWSAIAVNFSPDDAQLRRQQERFRSAPLPDGMQD